MNSALMAISISGSTTPTIWRQGFGQTRLLVLGLDLLIVLRSNGRSICKVCRRGWPTVRFARRRTLNLATFEAECKGTSTHCTPTEVDRGSGVGTPRVPSDGPQMASCA